jgi:2-polyprenyl-3-methyl-5-hydroxy-6-metoxy-1,4-benzoquinol methylase
MKHKTNSVKKKLLKLYKKNNPSIPTNLKERIKIIGNMFEKLSFPLRFLKNLTVGDIACGTGEYCMVAAKNGAKAEGFDFNEISVNIAKKNSKKLKVNNCKFYKNEFFKIKKKYDFVICTGTLHHLPNPYKGLKHLMSRVKKNGFLFVAFGLDTSNTIHNLMKLIVRNWGKSDSQIIKASKFLFQNHINRCVKFGLRKETTVLNDNFVNTQHYYLNLEKVLKILDKNFSLHSSWPPQYLPLSDPITNISVKKNNFTSSEFIWATKVFKDQIRIKKFTSLNNSNNYLKRFMKILNHNPNKSINEFLKKNKFSKSQKKIDFRKLDFSFNLNNYVNRFYYEIFDLMNFFEKKRSLIDAKKEINRKKYIFKGSNGLGLNYFIFKKN